MFLVSSQLPKVTGVFALVGLLVASCKNDSPGNVISPAQGQVNFIHAAWPQASNTLQLTVDDGAATGLTYGQSTDYVSLTQGAHNVKVNGSTTAGSSFVVGTSKAYTALLKPSTGSATPAVDLLEDDLSGPASGQAGFRLLDATGTTTAPAGFQLAQAVTSSTGTTYTVIATSAGSGFTNYAPGAMTLVVLDSNNQALASVGTARPRYEAGKLYTIILAGQPGATSTSAQPRAFLMVNK